MFRNASTINKDKEKIDVLSEMDSLNLAALPVEMLEIIAKSLPDKDLANFSLVNKGINCAVQREIEERFKMMVNRLDNQYKKIHDDNKSLQERVDAQIVADKTLCERIMLMLATCGLRNAYTGESMNDYMLRSGVCFGMPAIACLILMCMAMGLSFSLIIYMSHAGDFDDEKRELNEHLLKLALAISLIPSTLVCSIACIMHVPLMIRICRNGSDYAMSSLRLFSDRRTEARLANRIEDLEKRMEAGEANIRMDIEEFNARFQVEPFEIDESTPLLAARL